jgi:hypothetical protein
MEVASFNDKDASIKLTKNEIYSIMNGLKYEDAHVFTVKNNELIDQFEDLFIKITQKKS